MWNDLRFALRTLHRAPAFTLVATASLALGIGANTAVFSLVDQVYLRRLPVRAPEELVLVKDPGPYGNGGARSDGDQHAPFSHPVYLELRTAVTATVFSGLAARANVSVSVGTGKRSADLVEAELVSGDYFDVLGVAPAAGRLLTVEDDRVPDAHPVVVLAHHYWVTHFGGRPDAVGETIRVNTYPMTVVGVAAADFQGTQPGRRPDLFIPMMMKAKAEPGSTNLQDRTNRWLQLIGRLRPGMSREQAEPGLRAALQPSIERTLEAQRGDLPDDVRARARSRRAYLQPGGFGRETLRRDAGEALLIVFGLTGLVLVAACINVANLLVARGAQRASEIAIRLSVGASRGQLIRQLLVESMVLALAAAFLGLLVAAWVLDTLPHFVPSDAQGLLTAALLDWRAFAVTMAVALGTGLLFGLLPAWQSTRNSLVDAVKDQGTGGKRNAGGLPLRRILVSAQFALSVVLVVAGTLLARSLSNLSRIDPGFGVDRLVTFRMDASLSGFEPSQTAAVYRRLRDRLAAVPGVSDVAVSRVPVLADRSWTGIVVLPGCAESTPRGEIEASFHAVDSSFHRVLGLRLLEGRPLLDTDQREAAPVAVINQTLARRCFAGQPAVGREMRLGRNQRARIVGVVPDARLTHVRDNPQPWVYFPIQQAPLMTEGAFLVRTTLPESAALAALARAVREFDPNLAMVDARTMRQQIDGTLYNERLSGVLAMAFAALALTLAAVGLYGILAFLVTRRQREIGVRVALGASRARILWLVLREVVVLSVVGIGFGLPAAWLLARLLGSLLYGLAPGDPTVFAAAPAILAMIAAVAAYGPARRAVRVDPMRVLRYE